MNTSEIEPPDADALAKHEQFRKGQSDRKAGLPCASTNGKYLEGWYAPDKKAYYITDAQADSFNL
jgi:hypothetical protein